MAHFICLSSNPLTRSMTTTTTTTPTPTPTQKRKANSDLAKRWPEIMGKNNWNRLLNPMDPLLRVELIKYGEFSQCTHEAFNTDLYSTKYGSCKFQIEDFFDHPFMPQEGYKATKLILASSPVQNWLPTISKPMNNKLEENDIFIGFVAVSDDETTTLLGRRDICISWRGSDTGVEWNDDIIDYLKDAKSMGLSWSNTNVKVEAGFLDLYAGKDKNDSSARDQTVAEVSRLINDEYPTEDISITVTGHSLGAALALINGYDLVESKANVRRNGTDVVPLSVVTFGGPRVGNFEFKKSMESLGLRVLRVVNVRDQVPLVPGLVFNESLPDQVLEILDWLKVPWVYTHVGVKLEFDSVVSPYVKRVGDKDVNFHNLHTYIHILDGYQGVGKPFKSETGWDYALVNSRSSNLKEDAVPVPVPPEWRVEENKGMVQDQHGNWVHKSNLPN